MKQKTREYKLPSFFKFYNLENLSKQLYNINNESSNGEDMLKRKINTNFIIILLFISLGLLILLINTNIIIWWLLWKLY